MSVLVLLDSASHAFGTPAGGLSPFERDRGEEQGRILVNGVYVYELGHAGRETGMLEIGDYAEVSQDITPDGNAQLVRLNVDVVLPDSLPDDPAVEWEFTARYKGVVKYTRRLRVESRTLQLRDIAISLATSAPPDAVAFRLELVAA